MGNSSILITGATGGIGLAIAKALLSMKKRIIVTARNNEKLHQCFGEYGDNCIIIPWNISNIETLDEYIKQVIALGGPIEGFVHCAGHDKLASIYLNKTKDIEELLRVHAIAPIRLCGLISKRNNYIDGASIVLISSLAAHEGAVGHTAYAAAKGAIEGFLKPAAAELAERKIRINIVVLGVIDTPMSHVYLDRMDESQIKSLNISYPFGIGKPDDVVGTILYLLSEQSRWMTGQKIFLDGGHLSRKV